MQYNAYALWNHKIQITHMRYIVYAPWKCKNTECEHFIKHMHFIMHSLYIALVLFIDKKTNGRSN